MVAVKIECPYCGAALDCDANGSTDILCKYCGGRIHLDDGVVRVEYKEKKENHVISTIKSTDVTSITT